MRLRVVNDVQEMEEEKDEEEAPVARRSMMKSKKTMAPARDMMEKSKEKEEKKLDRKKESAPRAKASLDVVAKSAVANKQVRVVSVCVCVCLWRMFWMFCSVCVGLTHCYSGSGRC